MKARVCGRERFWKKKLRWLCWDLKRLRRLVSSIRESFSDGCGREPIFLSVLEKRERDLM